MSQKRAFRMLLWLFVALLGNSEGQPDDPCSSNPCEAGLCRIRNNGATWCDCTDTGLEGRYCNEDIDECLDEHACARGQVCINLVATFNCTTVGELTAEDETDEESFKILGLSPLAAVGMFSAFGMTLLGAAVGVFQRVRKRLASRSHAAQGARELEDPYFADKKSDVSSNSSGCSVKAIKTRRSGFLP